MAQHLFNPDKEEFLEAAIKYNGNITQLAEFFKVARSTMNEYINRNPDGKESINKAREFNHEFDLDGAEFVNRFFIHNYKSYPKQALQAAHKVIDKKGHKRGWKEETSLIAQETTQQKIVFEVNYAKSNDKIEVSPKDISDRTTPSPS